VADAAVEVRRGDRVESVIRADAAVVDSSGHLWAWIGNPDRETYWRSSAKPFQAIPVVTSGAAERFRFSEQDLAIICASHGGEPRHVERVSSILERIGAGPEHLICGVHPPSTRVYADALIRVGEAPHVLHNNCSGKHTGMLTLATQLGAPLEGYQEPDHPVQQAIRRSVGLFTGIEPAERIHTGVDGCGVPVFYLPVARMAYAYARLVDPRGIPDPEAGAARLIASAMSRNPGLVSGEGRLEVTLGEATGYRLTCKGGAEAVYCLGVPDRGVGVAVKVDDGTSRAIGVIVAALLSVMGLVSEEEAERLAAVAHPEIRNHAGRLVGEMVPVFEVHRGQVTGGPGRGLMW
jgi:L-asparaginase II